ncbi:MAG: D-alanyl-D-alanine carboxypeptidase (penicillin-binding protein 5/6) [Rhodospirillaceae bacterium]|nr:MAG: D-alanyl-D-alanine carboxypeptidase (penicillin-binding protein 5/6) [Rhodospirillaceae bacterium]
MVRSGFWYSTVFRLWGAVLVCATMASFPVRALDTAAKQALVLDHETGAVLLGKNADELMHPSSMSKLMTIYMVFDRLHEGNLSLDDTFAVSERAWRTAGSKMFVAINSRVTVSDLLRGIIVQSGNDACVVMAENLSGTEEAFAEAMTAKAHQIGLKRSTFRNASGWPAPDHLMTARDLAVLAGHLIADFPEYYPLFREMHFTYNGIRQGNRNPLLHKPELGADGLKTGHTEEGGYGLVASAVREGRRLVMVLNGLSSMKERAQESERLIDWAFREFTNITLFGPGAEVTSADVWLGSQAVVPLVIERGITVTLPRKVTKDIKVAAVFDSPIPAPIRKGDRLASLVITVPGIDPQEIPLLAGADVGRLGFFGRLLAAAGYLLWGGDGS